MEKRKEINRKTEIVGADIQQKMQLAVDKVESLQEIIKKLQMTKKFLHLNAVEVKASIHSNISRLLESLRSREVWLLNQVDVILQTKEDGLRLQEDQLNQAIGRLSNCLSLMDGGASLNNEFDDVLCRTDSLGKHPVESPHISFRADVARLRQAIHEFGRVDSKGLPLEAFASPHLQASSLPKPFEDYEDDDHHVFYKTIREIHEKKHGKSIVFNIPKLSSDIPSWVSPIHVPVDKGTKNLFGNFDQGEVGSKFKSTTIASERKRPTTACSVSQWMQEIKMEEEEDELMTSQVSSRYGNKGGMVTSASASCLFSGSRTDTKLQSNKVGEVPQLSRKYDLEGANDERPWMKRFSFLSPRLQDWLVDGDSRLPKMVTPAAFESFVFKPDADKASKETLMDNYLKKIAALPTKAWLAPSAESPKLESEMGSSLLENYMKKTAVLPWLISYRGVSKEAVSEFENDQCDGILENYAKRVANLDWLASNGRKELANSCQEAVQSAKPEGPKGFEGFVPISSSVSWLLTNDEKSVPGNHALSCDVLNISQLPNSHWLLPRKENEEICPLQLPQPPNSNKDHKESGESCDQKEDYSKPASSTNPGVPSIDEYFKALNSLSLDHWLASKSLVTSTPQEEA